MKGKDSPKLHLPKLYNGIPCRPKFPKFLSRQKKNSSRYIGVIFKVWRTTGFRSWNTWYWNSNVIWPKKNRWPSFPNFLIHLNCDNKNIDSWKSMGIEKIMSMPNIALKLWNLFNRSELHFLLYLQTVKSGLLSKE